MKSISPPVPYVLPGCFPKSQKLLIWPRTLLSSKRTWITNRGTVEQLTVERVIWKVCGWGTKHERAEQRSEPSEWLWTPSRPSGCAQRASTLRCTSPSRWGALTTCGSVCFPSCPCSGSACHNPDDTSGATDRALPRIYGLFFPLYKDIIKDIIWIILHKKLFY